MPSRTAQIAQVGKRKIELSNLTKVLFPDDHIVKAQLIEYYLKIAPTILAHLKGRPLSLVRYPDGIGGESFFQKNRPDWAPDWIQHVTLGEEKKDYVIATEEASLVWLANLACIELHQMHSRAPHFDKPDYIVYDFDPPENFKFPDVAELALEFKEHLFRFTSIDQVRASAERLKSNNIKESDDSFSGEFQGVLPKSRTFEFKLADQDGVLRGKVGPEIADADVLNREFLHKLVNVEFHVIQVGQGRPRYTLMSLDKIR